MKDHRKWLLVGVALSGLAAHGQELIPRGTIIPVRLNGTLSSKYAEPNKVISARVMQEVPLPQGMKIREGSKVAGHVIEVRLRTPGTSPVVLFTFDRALVSKLDLPVTTDLRAVASFSAIDSAKIPEFGMGEGESWSNRTTIQVGGDTVYWGGGPVVSRLGPVGKPLVGTDSGVLVRVMAKPGSPCRGDIDENHNLQALWVFSSDACGVYGLDGLTIIHAGRTEPLGVIEISAQGAEVKLPAGTGMLLRVISPARE